MSSTARRREFGSLRGVLVGTVLLVVGACLGIVAGSLLDGPRLLLRSLSQPVQSVDLAATLLDESTEEAGSGAAEDLTEFRALQEGVPEAAPLEAAPVAAAPERRPIESVASEEPRVETVIQEIAMRRGIGAPPAAAAPAAPRPAQPGEMVVQVGAFAERSPAEKLQERLRRMGFDAYLSERRPSGKFRFRVRVRPSQVVDAHSLASDLKARHFNVWVTRE